MTENMKIGSHRADKNKPPKRIRLDYRKIAAVDLDESLDRVFGTKKPKYDWFTRSIRKALS